MPRKYADQYVLERLLNLQSFCVFLEMLHLINSCGPQTDAAILVRPLLIFMLDFKHKNS